MARTDNLWLTEREQQEEMEPFPFFEKKKEKKRKPRFTRLLSYGIMIVLFAAILYVSAQTLIPNQVEEAKVTLQTFDWQKAVDHAVISTVDFFNDCFPADVKE